ncbi:MULTISPECIES: helix-turn-helix domain-containing protein [Bacillus cereus group]|uniref:A0A073KA69 (XRE family transcriptional regulator) n=2 Tax=Bacillus cereus group TaxID=86661 RepID=A0A1C3ZZW8_BACTU|nr:MULTISPECIES: helix-turn-helix domain-containing protein [Bacillus cereus group]MED3026363.1 helix-turn-helix domain-containing protein [Bacillus wiedmannii]OTX97414.1 transcriptional regulator [Bacillus thuringiensis serovar wratislaviensis]OUB62088.1 transcriptional regulator [Bacillus thuringiensis serovar sylvestriensis]QHV02381.1 helix-turn-helix domain-containing protein [Bacillus cereus]QHV43047.1 helix-turn-helix domain-containing protein [Bacillus cereus]
MIQELGKHIRTLRTQKSIGLNTFAKQLGVSPAYLSNLETGKTDTIQLSLLQKLQDELHLITMNNFSFIQDETKYRITRASALLHNLIQQDETLGYYLLETLERGIALSQTLPTSHNNDQDYYLQN